MIDGFTIALLTAEFGQVWAKLGLQTSRTTLGEIVGLHNCAVADKGSIATRAIDVTKIRPPTTAHKTQTNKHESTCSFD